MREKRAHRYFYIGAPGVVTLIVFAMVYTADGFFPFGAGSVAALDLNTQYLPLLYKFYDVVKGLSGMTADYHIAGGMNLYSEMVTELVNPFNYILLLFPREKLYLAVNLLPVLYGMAASVTASFAVHKISEKKSFVNLVLSVCYGMSFYNAYQFEIIRWMYLVVLFPLFAVSLKKMLEEEKCPGYTLLLAYQMILSLQLGFQTCLFTLCAAICYMLYLRADAGHRKDIGRKCLTLGCSTAAAIMISGVNYLPALYNILRSGRSRENQELLSVISQHGLDDILERILEISHPVVFGVLAGSFAAKRLLSGGKRQEDGTGQPPAWRRYTRLFLLLLLGAVILQPTNLLWHLGYYQCFPVRYGYMILCTLIFVAARQPDRDGDGSAHQARKIVILAAACVLNLAALVFVLEKRLMFSYAFATLAISRACLKETLLFYLLMLFPAAASAAAYMLFTGEQTTRAGYVQLCSKCTLLLTAMVTGAVCYLCILFPQGFEARTENETAYRAMGELGNTPALYSEAGHTSDEEAMLLNAPLVSGEYSLTAYMPAGVDVGFSEAMDDLGYSSPWVSVRSEGGTVVSDVLLGIHNPYVPDNGLQNGILISEEACAHMTEETKIDDSLLVQKAVLTAMCSEASLEADDVMQLWPAGSPVSDGTLPKGAEPSVCFCLNSLYELQITAEEPVLLYACTEEAGDRLYVNGELIERREAHQSQNDKEILFLGKYEQGKIRISAADAGMASVPVSTAQIAVVRLHAFQSLCGELAEKNQRVIEPDNRNGRLMIHSGNDMTGVLLLPFAYLEGYRTGDAGIQVSPYLGGLMKVRLVSPASEITLAFYYDILKPALMLSLAGLLMLVTILLLQKAQAPRRAGVVFCAAANRLFYVTAVLFLCNVYIAPNVGLAAYMTGKVFGRDILASYRAEQGENAETSPVLLQAAPEEDGIRVVVAGRNLVTSLPARLSADTVESRGFQAGKAGDGIVNDAASRWSSENNWEDASHYLQVDLRSVQTIRALRIFWFQNNAREYDILVSDDPSFSDCAVAASFTEAPASKEQVVYFEHPADARYLRVAVRDVRREEADLSLYYQNISIEEVEIYGDDSESFVIEKPVLPGGTGREVPVPDVPDGYTLSVGGINYDNLLVDGRYFADTCAPVDIQLGYVLTCGRTSFDLPGFDVTLPASDGQEIGSDAAAGDGGRGIKVCGADVREWKPAEGVCRADREKVSEQVDEALQKELGEEGYRIEIGKDGIVLYAGSARGLCYAHTTLEQMMQRTQELPCGTIRDYPAYPVRGFCIDAARRPVSMELLYAMVDELSARKMNTLQIHLNDNAIIAESEYDGTTEGARKLYSAFRLESDLTGEKGEPLTAADLSYTKEAFRALIEYALQKGVSIVPEIDTPAHSMAFTRIMPALGFQKEPELADTLDVSKPETLSFVKKLWQEYLSEDGGEPSVFGRCEAVHLGLDEYYGKTAPYEAYLKNLTDSVREMAPDKRIRIWGSLSAVGADLNSMPKDVELMLWSTYWADPKTMYDAGFKIINCLNSDLYIIVGGGTDHLDADHLSRDWQPCRFADDRRDITLPAWSDRVLGACYSLWSDHYTKGIDNTTESDLMERFLEPLDIIAGKLW